MLKVLKNYAFSIYLIAGVVVGAILGLTLGEKATVLQPFADIFLNMVFCLIVPIVLCSIAGSIASMENIGKLKKILLAFLAMMVGTGLITAVLAVLTGVVFDPAKGAVLDLGNDKDIAANVDIVSMLTTDDFVNLLSLKNMLPLIIFSLMLGIATSMIGDKGKPLVAMLNSCTAALSKMVEFVMKIAPFGIACYFASYVGKMDGSVVGSIVRLSVIYVCFSVVFFALYGTFFSWFGGGREGVRRYWKHIWLPLTTAAGTCSSTASIPANLEATKAMGIPGEVRNVVVPLAASTFKNGVISVQVFKILFLLGVFDREINIQNILLTIAVALVSGIIVGTIPSGGFIGEMFICSAFGFPASVVPIIVVMGTLTDSFCTGTSITNAPASCMTIARIVEGKDWIKRSLTEGDRESDEEITVLQSAV